MFCSPFIEESSGGSPFPNCGSIGALGVGVHLNLVHPSDLKTNCRGDHASWPRGNGLPHLLRDAGWFFEPFASSRECFIGESLWNSGQMPADFLEVIFLRVQCKNIRIFRPSA